MDIRPWEEVREILPPLSTVEKERLRRSIEADGIQEAIRVLPDGRIIDGHHRWELTNGEDIPYTVLDMPELRAFELAISLNLARRQLSNEQQEEVRRKAAEHGIMLRESAWQMLQEENLTQTETAKELGVDQSTISRWKDEVVHIMQDHDLHNAEHPSCRIKITKDDRYNIYDRYAANDESLRQIAADYHVSHSTISRNLKKVDRELEKAKRRKELAASGAGADLPNVTLLVGDFRQQMDSLPDDSVDLIFTDPPYDEKSIEMYGDLAIIAARVLKPEGSIITYYGHYAQGRIHALMDPHLWFWWPLIVKHSGASARLPGKWVFVEYKPLLWYVKERRKDNRYVSDMIYSEPPSKDEHEWQQDIAEAKYCIEKLTDEGDLIVDPFCGSGTTAIAALSLNRKVWTCDIDSKRVDVARGRINKWLLTENTQN